jgi:hypothetical protein
MSEQEQEKKKRKKKRHTTLLETERVESELFPELMKGLEELEKEKKYVDIQVCPKCKSPLVRRVGSMAGDMSAHMGLTPPSARDYCVPKLLKTFWIEFIHLKYAFSVARRAIVSLASTFRVRCFPSFCRLVCERVVIECSVSGLSDLSMVSACCSVENLSRIVAFAFID